MVPGLPVNQLTETYPYTRDFNQIATHTDPRSQISHYFYDPHGRLIEVRDPLLNSTKFEFNTHGLVTRAIDRATGPPCPAPSPGSTVSASTR